MCRSKGSVIEDERRAAVRTRASGGIIRSQVLCSDSERRTVERGSVLRAGAAGPINRVLSEREKRKKKTKEKQRCEQGREAALFTVRCCVVTANAAQQRVAAFSGQVQRGIVREREAAEEGERVVAG